MARRKQSDEKEEQTFSANPYKGLTLEDILLREKVGRPAYHYRFWPTMPRYGLRGGNGKYLTSGLFWEFRGAYPTPTYCAREHEVFHHDQGFWLPSARMIYVHSANEYQGAQKLVGSFEQWNRLKDLDWFAELLEAWEDERRARVIAEAQDALWLKGVVGLDTSAAKEIIRQNGGKVAPIGRPKTREAVSKEPDGFDYGAELEGLSGGENAKSH